MTKITAILLALAVATPALAQSRFESEARANAQRRTENKAVREAENPQSQPAAGGRAGFCACARRDDPRGLRGDAREDGVVRRGHGARVVAGGDGGVGDDDAEDRGSVPTARKASPPSGTRMT